MNCAILIFNASSWHMDDEKKTCTCESGEGCCQSDSASDEDKNEGDKENGSCCGGGCHS